jgi:mannosyltransferase
MTATVNNTIERLNSKFQESQTLQLALLGAIVLLATILRFYKLGEWSFWIDEIFTVGRAQAHYSSLERTLDNIPPHTNWIPLSLLLISGAIKALGVSEWSVRLVPAIIGVISIPILYLPTRKILGTGVALISSLLLAVSPWHIMWSQNGRFYVALMLLSFLTLLVFYFGLERNRPIYLLAGLFLFYLALSERMIAVFLLPVIAAYLIILFAFRFAKPLGLNRRNIIILALPVIGGLLIEVSSFLFSGNSRFLGDSDAFIGNAIDSPARILILIFFSIGLPMIVLGIFAGAWLAWQRNRAGLFLLLSATVPIIVLVAISPWVFVVERYALITLPAWLVLTAVAIERLFSWLPRQGKWLGLAALSLLLAHAAGDHLAYFALNNGNRLDWRGAYQYVTVHKAPEDLVASDRPEIALYYLDENEAVLDLSQITVDELAALEQTVWFVVDSHGIWAIPPANKEWLEDNAELLFVWYLRVREQIDLKAYRYEPPG